MGLACKSRKSRYTWSNRQVWPWSTKWSRAKADSFAKRTHWSWQTLSSNNTRDDSTHGRYQMVNTKIRLIKFFAAEDEETLYITSWQMDRETVETVVDFMFLGSKIIANGDCSQEIKRRLLLGWKVMTNLDSLLKSRDITLLTKVVQSNLWFIQ